MMPKLYTLKEVAELARKTPRALQEWLRVNPTDKSGKPLHLYVGRTRRFTADQVIRILSLILEQLEAGKAVPTEDGQIYFIDGGEHIKIGFTTSLQRRMVQLNTGAPSGVKLLHLEPGTLQTEKLLHRHFADLRVNGEWFKKSPVLLAHIERRKRLFSNEAQ